MLWGGGSGHTQPSRVSPFSSESCALLHSVPRGTDFQLCLRPGEPHLPSSRAQEQTHRAQAAVAWSTPTLIHHMSDLLLSTCVPAASSSCFPTDPRREVLLFWSLSNHHDTREECEFQMAISTSISALKRFCCRGTDSFVKIKPPSHVRTEAAKSVRSFW